MYATVGGDVPDGAEWTFEPKYDGMRVLAHIDARAIRLITRNGKDKTAQFPEIIAELRSLSTRVRRPLLLDGEIVALHRGRPGSFQALQGRMHLKDADEIRVRAGKAPAALMVFDILRDGGRTLMAEPWHARRKYLERILGSKPGRTLRLGETTTSGARMIARARRAGWEGVIAKRTSATYRPGARSRDWLKLKLQYRAEFVVGGFTEPRRSRQHLGALLLGYYDAEGRFQYAGHTGGGFDQKGLKDMRDRLTPLERPRPPFVDPPRTNEQAHWVAPKVVVEVKFAEWTSDGRLRQPIFLGVRDDKAARDVRRERESVQYLAQRERDRVRVPAMPGTASARAVKSKPPASSVQAVLEQFDRITRDGGEGELRLARQKLHVTNLGKPYFGDGGPTKGDVMRYYTRVSPALLPLIRDRPMVLKRYPNGITGPSFFQQNVTEGTPDGVRTAEVVTEQGGRAARFIGGDLFTLLYTVQIGTIAVHTWLSRLAAIDHPDYSIIDLDPGDDVPFVTVVGLARSIAEILKECGLRGAVKTSGSSGLHIALPLPARTSFERSAALATRVAEMTVERHPDLATVERRMNARPAGTIYVDAQQNAHGKSVVAAYSVRARAGATISTPLRWSELTPSLRIQAHTVRSVPSRLTRIGEVWSTSLKPRNAARTVERVLEDES
jgi:bifunctional non-homologous end joining protein LigD